MITGVGTMTGRGRLEANHPGRTEKQREGKVAEKWTCLVINWRVIRWQKKVANLNASGKLNRDATPQTDIPAGRQL